MSVTKKQLIDLLSTLPDDVELDGDSEECVEGPDDDNIQCGSGLIVYKDGIYFGYVDTVHGQICVYNKQSGMFERAGEYEHNQETAT